MAQERLSLNATAKKDNPLQRAKPLFTADIVSQLHDGNQEQWDAVIRDISRPLGSFIAQRIAGSGISSSVNDILQDIWLDVFEHRQRLDATMSISYFFGIARHKVARLMNPTKIRREHVGIDAEHITTSHVAPSAETLALQRIKYNALPYVERVVLVDLASGYSPEEIAERREMIEGTVYATRASLRRHLSPYQGGNILKDDRQQWQEDEREYDTEEQARWLQTIDRVSFKDAIALVRCAQGLSRKDYAQNAGINQNLFYEFENNENFSSLGSLNKFIRASNLGYQSKAAQLLRLKAFGLDGMTLDYIAGCTFKDVFKNLRIMRGAQQIDLEDESRIPQSKISTIENNEEYVPSEEYVEKFITWLGVAGTVLDDIIRHKAAKGKQQIPESMLNQLLGGKYLFVKSPREGGLVLSDKEQQVREELNSYSTIGAKITYLQEKHNFSARDWARQAGISHTAINDAKSGKRTPSDETVAILLMSLGYTIHNPIMWDCIKQAKKENRRIKAD